MYSLLLILFLLSLIPAIFLGSRAYSAIRPTQGEIVAFFGFLGVIGLIYFIGLMICVALTQDLHLNPDSESIVIFGVVILLGVNSVLYLFFRGAKRLTNGDDYSGSAGSSITTVTSVVGLVSSLLGIVAFFWDHFFKK